MTSKYWERLSSPVFSIPSTINTFASPFSYDWWMPWQKQRSKLSSYKWQESVTSQRFHFDVGSVMEKYVLWRWHSWRRHEKMNRWREKLWHKIWCCNLCKKGHDRYFPHQEAPKDGLYLMKDIHSTGKAPNFTWDERTKRFFCFAYIIRAARAGENCESTKGEILGDIDPWQHEQRVVRPRDISPLLGSVVNWKLTAGNCLRTSCRLQLCLEDTQPH